MIDGLQLIAATFAVLALVLMLAHGMRRFLERSRTSNAAVHQVGSWRVAPDASVRAVRVLDRVHLLYERGRETVVLDQIDESRVPELEAARTAKAALGIVGAKREITALAARVAKG